MQACAEGAPIFSHAEPAARVAFKSTSPLLIHHGNARGVLTEFFFNGIGKTVEPQRSIQAAKTRTGLRSSEASGALAHLGLRLGPASRMRMSLARLVQAPRESGRLEPVRGGHRMTSTSLAPVKTTRTIAPEGCQPVHHVAGAFRVGPGVVGRLQDAQSPGGYRPQPEERSICIDQGLLHTRSSNLRSQPMGEGLYQLLQSLRPWTSSAQGCGASRTAVVGNNSIDRGGPCGRKQSGLASTRMPHRAQNRNLRPHETTQGQAGQTQAPGPYRHRRPTMPLPARVNRAKVKGVGVVAAPLRSVDPGQRDALLQTLMQRGRAHYVRPASVWADQQGSPASAARPGQGEGPRHA